MKDGPVLINHAPKCSVLELWICPFHPISSRQKHERSASSVTNAKRKNEDDAGNEKTNKPKTNKLQTPLDKNKGKSLVSAKKQHMETTSTASNATHSNRNIQPQISTSDSESGCSFGSESEPDSKKSKSGSESEMMTGQTKKQIKTRVLHNYKIQEYSSEDQCIGCRYKKACSAGTVFGLNMNTWNAWYKSGEFKRNTKDRMRGVGRKQYDVSIHNGAIWGM